MGVHVMVDLETFGVGRGAMPISIGAVKFDGTYILDRFHVGISPTSAEAAGFKMSASTVMWWLDPERADAWRAWCELDKVSISEALTGFAMWYKEPCVGDELSFDGKPIHEHGAELPIWGNGATFDNVILRGAFDLCGFEFPCQFWADKCYRTVKGFRPSIKLQRIGTHHSAVDDAESQAVHLQDLCAALGIVL